MNHATQQLLDYMTRGHTMSQEIAGMLAANGADMNIVISGNGVHWRGLRPVEYAAEKCLPAVLRIFLEAGAEVTPAALENAALSDPAGEKLRLLLDFGGVVETEQLLRSVRAKGDYERRDYARVERMLEDARKNGPLQRPLQNPDEVDINRTIGNNRVLQEIFNFAVRERVTLLRAGVTGTVESMQRETFDAVDDRSLRAAFDTYRRRGGKIPEEKALCRGPGKTSLRALGE